MAACGILGYELDICKLREDELEDIREQIRHYKKLRNWIMDADLFRIKGVAGQFAELLEAAGVDTVKEFRHRVAANLQPKLVEVNEAKNLCNRVPSVAEVEKMIAQAKELEPIVTY